MAKKKVVEPAAKAAVVAPAVAETKSKAPKVLLIVLAVIGGLAVLGFILMLGTSMFVGSQIMKNVDINTSTDGKTVTLGSGEDSVTVSDAQKWPDTVPSTVPEFRAGKIAAAARFGDTWTVTAEDVTSADFDTYVASLKSAGYTMDESFDMTGIRSAGGTKGGYKVSITYTEDETNKNIMIGVVKE